MLPKHRIKGGIPAGGLAWRCPEARQAPDEKLARRVQFKDGRALAQIYDRYARLVFSVALNILHDRASAEEVVQEVFAKVWCHAGEFEAARGKFSAWLIRIAHNQSIDEMRRRRCRPIGETMENEKMAALASDDDPVDEAQLAFERARVRRALSCLSVEQRRAIELAYFEGLTQSEIAARLATPLGTVKTRIRLGMLKLKEMLVEEAWS